MSSARECVGIDCSKDLIDACFGTMDESMTVNFKEIRQFKNDPKGFNQLLKWTGKLSKRKEDLRFVIEVTGVYYESLAYFLDEKGCALSVVLPTHSFFYKKTLSSRTITDKEMAKALTQMGLERKLDNWKKPDPWWKKLKSLTREREDLMQDKTSVTNRLHAYEHSVSVESGTISRLNDHLELLEKQIDAISRQVHLMVKQNPEVKSKINQITSIPGVGLLTAVTILAETDAFNLIRNRKQLVCYAGYDVIKKESGSSVHSKGKISKKGNGHIRRALYMPALSAAKHNPTTEKLYSRIVARSGIKMKGNVAVQRKLLLLIYAIWKSGESFSPDYQQPGKKVGEQVNAPPTRASKVSSTAISRTKKINFSKA